jgi:HKD family nuclease
MVIEVVDNHGVTNMSAELTRSLTNCTTARLATASLTRKGMTAIENALSLERRGFKVNLLVGLYNGHTEAAALRKLLTLQKRAKGSLEVRVAENFRFHWKVYLFNSGERVTAYIGSSNLTGDGLGAEGEFNLRVTAGRGDRALRNIAETFDRTWRKGSVPLTALISDRFAPISQRSRQFLKQIDPEIRKVLVHVRRPEPNVRQKVSNHVPVFTFFEEFAASSTNQEVKSKTSWHAKTWDWMVFPTRAARDRLLNARSFYLAEIRRAGGWISLNDVRDEDEFGTQDGRFFIAYQKRRGSVSRALNKRTFKMLKTGGLIARKGDLCRERRLSSAHRALLNRLLNVPE